MAQIFVGRAVSSLGFKSVLNLDKLDSPGQARVVPTMTDPSIIKGRLGAGRVETTEDSGKTRHSIR